MFDLTAEQCDMLDLYTAAAQQTRSEFAQIAVIEKLNQHRVEGMKFVVPVSKEKPLSLFARLQALIRLAEKSPDVMAMISGRLARNVSNQ